MERTVEKTVGILQVYTTRRGVWRYDLKGQKLEMWPLVRLFFEGQQLEVVAARKTDLEAREQISGCGLSAWGALALVLREIRRLTAERNVKYSRLAASSLLRTIWNRVWFSHLVWMVSRGDCEVCTER